MTTSKTFNKRILVFPCGTEIGLEIHRALARCAHVEVFGANSVASNHGAFVFKNYLTRLPMVDDPLFMAEINASIQEHAIDYVYPAHDDVVLTLARHGMAAGCEMIGSPRETCELCRSKSATYARFAKMLPVPALFPAIKAEVDFPLFLKPDRGQGSRGARMVHSREEWATAVKRTPGLVALEYLPGPEYTVDCFTDRHGALRFAGARERVRTSGGISVHARPVQEKALLTAADSINKTLALRGAWFFQMKRNAHDELVLLEIAPRVSGGMGLFRNLGINLPLLSVYDRAGLDVDVMPPDFDLIMDRALVARFDHDISYDHVYVDLDDTLIHGTQVDIFLVAFLFQCRNQGRRLHLLTRHGGEVSATLSQHALSELFDSVCHLDPNSPKSAAITERLAIFIDDSHSERKEVRESLGIPVFAPDAVEALLDWRL